MLLFLAPLAFALAVCASAHADGFLKGIPDLPLMAGLTEDAEPTVFETDKGRVMNTRATGQIGSERIAAYYRQTLPALGWKQEGDGLAFTRGTERLELHIREPASARPVEVRFQLVAKLASVNLPE